MSELFNPSKLPTDPTFNSVTTGSETASTIGVTGYVNLLNGAPILMDGAGSRVNLATTAANTVTATGLDGPAIFKAGSFLGTNTYENRVWQVATLENVAGTAGAYTTLCNLSGAGNVSSLQIAISAAYGNRANMVASQLRITIDGGTPVVVPLGILFLADNFAFANNNSYASDNIALRSAYSPSSASGGGTAFGGYRRIYMPYGSACKIEIQTPNVATQLFTQVQYYAGTIPDSVSQQRRNRFGVSYVTGTPAQGGALQVLNVTGRGRIESVQVEFTTPGNVVPYYLEGNPTFVLDGTTVAYGGTEDFFGTQYYDSYGQTINGGPSGLMTDSWGVVQKSIYSLDGGTTYNTGFAFYRFFEKDPVIFNTSATLNFYNGQSGEGNGVANTTISALVFYTLDQ